MWQGRGIRENWTSILTEATKRYKKLDQISFFRQQFFASFARLSLNTFDRLSPNSNYYRNRDHGFCYLRQQHLCHHPYPDSWGRDDWQVAWVLRDDNGRTETYVVKPGNTYQIS
ncbi:hypothetical protein ABKN59_010739 [Abortiporus biennis]